MVDVRRYIQFCPICCQVLQQVELGVFRCPECMIQWEIRPRAIEKNSPLKRQDPYKSPEDPILPAFAGA